MLSFKGAHFPQDSILTGVRWYVAYPLSYRHVEALLLWCQAAASTRHHGRRACG
jgi:transposase-like protein